MLCGCQSPDEDHFLNYHKVSSCLGKDRIFRRKDKLREHLRVCHNATLIEKNLFCAWERPTTSRSLLRHCNICGKINMPWNARCEHVRQLEENGANMEAHKAITMPEVSLPLLTDSYQERTSESGSVPLVDRRQEMDKSSS